MKNKNQGITLVALIITVIVLLILAGVTISSIAGKNGMLEKISAAKEASEQAHIKEEVELAIQEFYMEKAQQGKLNEINLKNLSEYLSKKLDNIVIKELTTGKIASVEKTPVVNERLVIEYKGYELEVNNKYNVKILGKVGLRVEYAFESQGYTKDFAVMAFNISTPSGVTVTSITPLTEGTQVVVANSKYKFTANGTYEFKIVTSDNNTRVVKVSVDKFDNDAPNGIIEVVEAFSSSKGTLKAKLTLIDAKSGVSLQNSKWVLNTEDKEIGTDASLYTGGTLTKETEEIEMSVDDSVPGDYYIHLLATDNLGNSKEIISGKVATVEASFASILTPTNYGDPIQYSANGESNWKVFYSDGNRVYIITSDVTKHTNCSAYGLEKKGEYAFKFQPSYKYDYDAIDESVRNLFKFSIANYKLTGNNGKALARLMDSAKWKLFIESGLTGAVAIGGPTVEMWVASWNAKGYQKIYTKDRGNNADLNISLSASSITGTSCNLSSYTGKSDTLYFPRTSDLVDTASNITGYWLTSIPNESSDTSLYCADWKNIRLSGRSAPNTSDTGIRPVVCLPAGIKASKNDQGVWVLDKTSLNN